eukprot:1479597-Rhodomonas_salina.2
MAPSTARASTPPRQRTCCGCAGAAPRSCSRTIAPSHSPSAPDIPIISHHTRAHHLASHARASSEESAPARHSLLRASRTTRRSTAAPTSATADAEQEQARRPEQAALGAAAASLSAWSP